ncbi:cadherin repeat domain-containing protein [Rasiella sp. SM2506]|uniref:cadherin repeat domain-containing protein n=1 Tax=Rasiella sp. SM2506 TaxID=3423914 RepID=UPI003D79D3FF
MNYSNRYHVNYKKLRVSLLSAILCITSLLIMSCSSNDDATETNNSITVQDLITITIDENAQPGQSIGIINAISNRSMTFTILEQDFTNAIAIHPSTGALTVADASIFDFETNPVIQGVVEIKNGIETATTSVRIELNNNDDIAFSLTASKQAYLNAEAGDWIEITVAEYEKLNEVLNEVTNFGPVSDGTSNTPSVNGVITLANFDQSTGSINSMPNRSLVFAFKYFAVETQLNSDRHRVKQSSSTNSTGFENIGNPLPAHEKMNGDVCFVLKGSKDAITSNQGFLGFQKSSGSTMGLMPNNGVLLFSLGEASNLNMESNGVNAAYYGLSTTVKQWD